MIKHQETTSILFWYSEFSHEINWNLL